MGRAWLASLSVAALLVLGACAPSAPITSSSNAPTTGADRHLIVFAASSLIEPFGEIATAFEDQSEGVRVDYNFGGTPQLRAQLELGARADVFAAANEEQMAAAVRSGIVTDETPIIAQNRLVVIVPKGNPANIRRLEDLANPGVKLLITQPDVPVGVYTRDALRKMAADPRFGADYDEEVLANVQSEESNVKQLVAKIRLGEADAAFVYSSDVSPAVANDVTTIAVPDEFNTIARYPVAVVKEAPHPALARAFVEYLRSEAAQSVLRKHGFMVPEATARSQKFRHG